MARFIPDIFKNLPQRRKVNHIFTIEGGSPRGAFCVSKPGPSKHHSHKRKCGRALVGGVRINASLLVYIKKKKKAREKARKKILTGNFAQRHSGHFENKGNFCLKSRLTSADVLSPEDARHGTTKCSSALIASASSNVPPKTCRYKVVRLGLNTLNRVTLDITLFF